MSPKSKVQSPKSKNGNRLRRRITASPCLRVAMLLLLTAHCSLLTVPAHEGEDHSKDAKTKTSTVSAGKTTASSVIAERNVQTESGSFNIKLMRFPSDPRTGEQTQMTAQITEKVEGGFAGNDTPLENPAVVAEIRTADGTQTLATLAPKADGDGKFSFAHAFPNRGDYKVFLNVTTTDRRNFNADFPVSVTNAPTNRTFWIGLIVLGLLTIGAIGASVLAFKGAENNRRKIVLASVAGLLFFILSAGVLAFVQPPRQTRNIGELAKNAESLPNASTLNDALGTALNISKESQLLFGIKTETVGERQITSGLKVSGVVRARPDAKAIVSPQVAGKITLREGLTIGSAVGRGEQIGTVEQVLDVSGQTALESQRLEVEAQQREVEAKRLELKNTALALQSQQAERRAQANQARTRLAQAQRELRRSENLLEVGAVPRKRVEEAQTAVKVIEQEIAAAEQQIKLFDTQIKAAQAGQNIFRSPQIRQPSRSFSLVAPVTGIINEIKIASGQQVEAGAELLNIVNLSTVLIEAQVFERDLPLVRESPRKFYGGIFKRRSLSNRHAGRRRTTRFHRSDGQRTDAHDCRDLRN